MSLNIAVEGNENISDEEIIELSTLQPDQHMLSLDLGAIGKARRETSPFSRCCASKRKFPNTVTVTVRERKRDAVVQYMEAGWYSSTAPDGCSKSAAESI